SSPMSPLLLLVCLIVPAQPPAAVRIVPGTSPTRAEVIATIPPGQLASLPHGKLTQAQGEAVLRLALRPGGDKQPAAMLGTYERRKDELIFRPRFNLQHDLTYRAYFE